MPLDGHSYLVAQGWAGKGSALRPGALARPITVVQKKNLGGVGKDRDEAFPFWDHLFTAAASAIQLKLDDSDDENDAGPDMSTTATLAFTRTSTGILSNRRPVEGTPAASGSATPDPAAGGPRYTLMALAKRQAAARALYSRFFRGPVVGPEDEEQPMVATEEAEGRSSKAKGKEKASEDERGKGKEERRAKADESLGGEDGKKRRREERRKRKEAARTATVADGKETKKTKKKRKRSEEGDGPKSAPAAEDDSPDGKKAKKRKQSEGESSDHDGVDADPSIGKDEAKRKRRAEKEQRRAERAATKAAKAEAKLMEGRSKKRKKAQSSES